MSFFFVKALKEFIIHSLHSASPILGCFCGFGGSFKDKVDGIVLFTEFSVAAIFAVCFQQKYIWGKTNFLCHRMERELFWLPSAKTQSWFGSSEVESLWGLVSPWCFPAVCGGWAQSHWADCGGDGPEPTPDNPPEMQGALGGAQLCIPTIVWHFCQHILHPPISGCEQRKPLPISPVNIPEFS